MTYVKIKFVSLGRSAILGYSPGGGLVTVKFPGKPAKVCSRITLPFTCHGPA
jgi:hypothetical protein